MPMQTPKLFAPLFAAFIVAASAPSYADDEGVQDPGDPNAAVVCNTNGYKTESIKYNPSPSIPDGDTAGLLLGPIQFADDGQRISDVVLDLYASHTKIGDLTISLLYDVTCDGTNDYESIVVCRPRGTQTTTPAPCGTGTGGGCGGDLQCDKLFTFSDGATNPIATGTCPSVITKGCYKPSTVGGSPLSVFKDLPKGGCWYLKVVDHVTPNKGAVCEWAVHILNHVHVGVETTTWTRSKVLYR